MVLGEDKLPIGLVECIQTERDNLLLSVSSYSLLCCCCCCCWRHNAESMLSETPNEHTKTKFPAAVHHFSYIFTFHLNHVKGFVGQFDVQSGRY